MGRKHLPKCLLATPPPTTATGRGVYPICRGLVDTCVEGHISLIRLIQAGNMRLGRGCRYFSPNCSKERERIGARRGEKGV
jgi:hypothetical protein